MFLFLKTVQFHLWGLAHFLLQEHWRNKTNLTVGKLRYLPHYLLDRGIKGTVVNWACPCFYERSLKITTKCNEFDAK